MNAPNKPLTLLWNPFVYIAGARALLLGLAAILAAGFIGSFSNTHFDGVLDTHSGAAVPLWAFLVEGLIDWLSLAVVLLLLGRLISRTSFRTIDVLGTQALARWPAVLISVAVIPPVFQRFTNSLVAQIRAGGPPQINGPDAVAFFVIALAMLVFLCWMIALMYRSFSVSCNVKGGKAIGTFIAGLLLAEIVSKLCLGPILQHAITPGKSKGSNPAVAAERAAPVVIDPANSRVEFARRWTDQKIENPVA
jgi:hypothetical protein